MVLTENERNVLHTAILQYLKVHGFDSTRDYFQKELEERQNTTNFQYKDQLDCPLEKRWNTLVKLNLKNLELEEEIKRLNRELTSIKDPTRSNLMTEEVLSVSKIPTEPALCELLGHKDAITALTLHPSDNLCISASEDGTLRIWDLESRTDIQILRSHCSAITSVAIEPIQGHFLASCSTDQTIKIYEMLNSSVAHSNAGTRNEHGGTVLSLSTHLSFSINNPLFTCINTLVGHDDTVSAIAWSNNGIGGNNNNNSMDGDDATLTLFSVSRDGFLNLWDVRRGVMRYSVNLQRWMKVIVASPLNNGMLLMAGEGGEEVVLVKTNAFSGSDMQRQVASFFKREKYIGQGLSMGRNFDEDGNIVTLLGHSNRVTCCTFSSFEVDCVMIEAFGCVREKAEIRDLIRQKEEAGLAGFAPLEWLKSVGYSPQFIASGGRDKNIFIHDIRKNSGGGRGKLTEGAGSGVIINYNENNNSVIMKFESHEDWVRDVAFTANGKYLVSCGDDGLLLVHDIVKGRLFRKIMAHNNFITCMALHLRNKSYMVTGDGNAVIKLWQCE